MFCTNCGKEIINTARFCNYCGSPVQPLMPPPPPVYPSQNMGQPYIPGTPAPEVFGSEQNYTAVQPERVENAVSGTFAENAPEVSAAPENFDDNSDMSDHHQDPEQTAAVNYETADTGNYIPDPAISGAAPEAETISGQTAVNNSIYSAAAEPYPMPGAIPKSGGSFSGAYSMPMPDTAVNIAAEPVIPTPKRERERKYTLGHILLCLASTAIMAITAGVFAGLYFSVV